VIRAEHDLETRGVMRAMTPLPDPRVDGQGVAPANLRPGGA
jgi:hypothetical protein